MCLKSINAKNCLLVVVLLLIKGILMHCNIQSTYSISNGKCCRNKKLTCTSPPIISPHRVFVWNALSPSLSSAAVPGCNLPRQETGNQERIDQTINGHCLALPPLLWKTAGHKKENTPGAPNLPAVRPVANLLRYCGRVSWFRSALPTWNDALGTGFCVPKVPFM